MTPLNELTHFEQPILKLAGLTDAEEPDWRGASSRRRSPTNPSSTLSS